LRRCPGPARRRRAAYPPRRAQRAAHHARIARAAGVGEGGVDGAAGVARAPEVPRDEGGGRPQERDARADRALPARDRHRAAGPVGEEPADPHARGAAGPARRDVHRLLVRADLMAEVAAEGSGLPSGRRIASMALAGIALTLVLMVLRFPYDRLALFLPPRVEQPHGARVSIGPVSLALVRWAPGIAATGVQINQRDGTGPRLRRPPGGPPPPPAWVPGRPAAAARGGAAR